LEIVLNTIISQNKIDLLILKKNVIIIMIDAGRNDRAKKSPFFNKLKYEAICFSQPITYGPHTIAAMHATFSGAYGCRTGTNSYWSTYLFKKNKFKTLTEYLKENNYYTCADIVNQLVIPQQGFDEFLIHDEKKDDLKERHVNLLHKMKEKNEQDQSFFLYIQYSNIHTTIVEEVLKPYDNFSKEYFENRQKNEERYDKLFKNAEKYLETILKNIQDLEIKNNSLILIMSDHGISVGEKEGERAYGAFCYDYTLKAFAYFMASDFIPKEITQQIRLIDYMPTILDYLNIDLDSNYEDLDGESLMPLIKGGKSKEKFAFSETGNTLKEKQPPKEPNTRSIRTSKWKLIFNEYNNTKELYDLENDPNEENNLTNKGLEIEKMLWNEMNKILSNR